jgi:hypothetical protein
VCGCQPCLRPSCYSWRLVKADTCLQARPFCDAAAQFVPTNRVVPKQLVCSSCGASLTAEEVGIQQVSLHLIRLKFLHSKKFLRAYRSGGTSWCGLPVCSVFARAVNVWLPVSHCAKLPYSLSLLLSPSGLLWWHDSARPVPGS